MTKKKTAKKQDKKENSEEKKTVKDHVKKHLDKKVTIGTVVGIALVLIVLFFPVKYEATESYIDINEYEEEYQVKEPDLDNPKDVEVCVDVPAKVKISDNSTANRPFGLYDYKCEASFKVWNQEDTVGEWTYSYVFNINGKEFKTESQTRKIQPLAPLKFDFESDECKEGDKLTGRMELIKGPTTSECEYEVQYDEITVTKTRLVTEEIEKERKVTLTKPLWKKIFGL